MSHCHSISSLSIVDTWQFWKQFMRPATLNLFDKDKLQITFLMAQLFEMKCKWGNDELKGKQDPYSLPTEEMAKQQQQQILSTFAGPIQGQINNVNSIKHNPLLLLFLIYKTLLGFKCNLVDKRTLYCFPTASRQTQSTSKHKLNWKWLQWLYSLPMEVTQEYQFQSLLPAFLSSNC